MKIMMMNLYSNKTYLAIDIKSKNSFSRTTEATSKCTSCAETMVLLILLLGQYF